MENDPGTVLDRHKNPAPTTVVSISDKAGDCTERMGKQEDKVLKHKHCLAQLVKNCKWDPGNISTCQDLNLEQASIN